MNRLAFIATILSLPALGGCIAAGDVRPYQPMAVVHPRDMPAQATAGAIYAAGPGMQLYGDKKARDVGDLLTINLVESTSATSTANTRTAKSNDTSISAPTVFGAPVTLGGRDIIGASMSGERSFDGSGNTAQSNRLAGSITVTVTQRLANGNLVVSGQKNMRLNQGDELVQIQGIVRPVDINPDNSVPSSRVGNAQIAYGGRGVIAQSNSMGWLARFFNSRLYPY
jgi:flagellar L-ring protein FlgH